MPDPVIVFRDDIGAYDGKGSPLIKGEVDSNFHELLLAIIALQAVSGNLIDHVSYTSTSFTLHLTGGGTATIPLPTALFRPRGVWTNNETYFVNDTVSVNAVGTFVALQEHQAPPPPETFDPSAETTDGPLWFQISEAVDMAGVMRWQGEFTADNEYAEFDVVFNESYGSFVVLQPVQESSFDPYAETTDGRLYFQLAPPAFAPIKTVSGTEYELTREDFGCYIRFTSASGCIVTFPSGLDLPANAEAHLRQAGDGPVSFVEGDTNVVLNPQRDGYETATPWKGATVTAKWQGGDEFDLIGPHGDELSA